MPDVLTEQAGGVAVLTLNAPQRRNAVTPELAAELAAAVGQLSRDPSVAAIVITGAGQAFCAGADRQILADADEQALRSVYQSFLAVRAAPVPTIAAVNGPAVGAGLNLALACDVRLAAASAVFDARFLQIPIHPGGGHLWMLQRLVGSQAATAMVVLAQPVSGAEAVRIGLAWQCVPDEMLLEASRGLCRALAESPTPVLARRIKSSLRASAALSAHEDAVELELAEQLASTRHPAFAERMARGARRRTP
jgi:enoyl-CoA hydratase